MGNKCEPNDSPVGQRAEVHENGVNVQSECDSMQHLNSFLFFF